MTPNPQETSRYSKPNYQSTATAINPTHPNHSHYLTQVDIYIYNVFKPRKEKDDRSIHLRRGDDTTMVWSELCKICWAWRWMEILRPHGWCRCTPFYKFRISVLWEISNGSVRVKKAFYVEFINRLPQYVLNFFHRPSTSMGWWLYLN